MVNPKRPDRIHIFNKFFTHRVRNDGMTSINNLCYVFFLVLASIHSFILSYIQPSISNGIRMKRKKKYSRFSLFKATFSMIHFRLQKYNVRGSRTCVYVLGYYFFLLLSSLIFCCLSVWIHFYTNITNNKQSCYVS